MGNRSAFIVVPETLESHGIPGNGMPAVPVRPLPGSDGAAWPRAVQRAACRRERSLRLHRYPERAALPAHATEGVG